MLSGESCPPGLVRVVEIPKKDGTRVLGIPNVVDRVAQAVVVMALELKRGRGRSSMRGLPDGYRPGRARAGTRSPFAGERCFRRDWVVDLDIPGFFLDSVPAELMLRAVAYDTDQKWVVMYVGALVQVTR